MKHECINLFSKSAVLYMYYMYMYYIHIKMYSKYVDKDIPTVLC